MARFTDLPMELQRHIVYFIFLDWQQNSDKAIFSLVAVNEAFFNIANEFFKRQYKHTRWHRSDLAELAEKMEDLKLGKYESSTKGKTQRSYQDNWWRKKGTFMPSNGDTKTRKRVNNSSNPWAARESLTLRKIGMWKMQSSIWNW
ncbi:hypothetical protein PMZ80_007304 [Knufia obscura]|uniref:Uncharacterized protein n=2 Tax=Knufia TaxID=430999 RepID=A0AAN8I7I7_9EURO|nr:hypothetical protein PMZ80_007304 [Knufia obscura]KAK5953316.1 hypothetical protein OHC33_005884 [Knufia fluminis]